jgi:signal transduction histidine kinase
MRIQLFFGESIPLPYRPLPDDNLLRRGWALVRDPSVWKDLIYLILLFPMGVAELLIALTTIGVSLLLISLPSWYWAIDNSENTGLVIDTLPEALAAALAGVVLLIGSSWLLVGIARAHELFARWMLGPSSNTQLVERVNELTQARSGIMEATLQERRRIERDLHDGAQQRIVALALDLGMAREKRAADPDAAWALIDQAHDEAKRALAELRELVQGIHPAILTDRGLDAAISAVAARSQVPVTVDVDLPDRPSEAVESTAYFVVVEALANVAKHSGASHARVTIRENDDRLAIDVSDDGAGNADLSRGSGLRGLRDRIQALDGTFRVESSAGSGTRVYAEIPCAS